MNEQNNLQAQLQGLQAALEKLESEYASGQIELAHYLRLKTEYETRKAGLAQASADPTPDLDSPAYQQARAKYLAALRRRYGVVLAHSLSVLAEDERAGSTPQLPLLGQSGVYVPLTFDAPAHLGRQAELTPLGLGDVLALRGHLAFIGDAGSGKTTLLHVLVTALAFEKPTLLLPRGLALGLPYPRPLPVLLPLRVFEHACSLGQCQRTASDLLDFVDGWFGQWSPGVDLPPGFMAEHIRAGRAWLLLDALDEVPDPAHRQTVRNIIHELSNTFAGTRIIVTARVAGYRGARLDERRFTVARVRDLDAGQRERMIRAIYQGLGLGDVKRRTSDLIACFQEQESLRDLGRTPVMIWTAAVIHALRGRLPESRAALYDSYVDILLKHSYKRSRYDTESIEVLSDRLGWRLQDRRHYLTYAAFQVHRLLEGQPERRGKRRPVVGEDELSDHILARYFRDNLKLNINEARGRAREFLALMAAHSGLLHETPQGYAVGDHLTMQEFLAGCYLGDHYQWEDEAGYRAFMHDKVGDSWWREVFILAAGYLAGKPGFYAPGFLKQVAAQGQTPSEQLAALSLAAWGLLQLRHLLQRPSWYDGLARELAEQLYEQVYRGEIAVPLATRQDAALALGLLHGCPGEGGLGDPRFARPGGLPDFAFIQGGEFWMGGEEGRENELPHHRVYLDDFELACFPSTNAMFAHFVNAEGYAERRWWAAAINDGYWAEGRFKDLISGWRDRPAYWDDARFNNPAQPVVGVSWYEAVAYCAWLTAALDDGYTYHLPSEAQWERAARGTGGGRYPWGDEWAEGLCNNVDTGLESTSPVGLFSRGATPDGIEDLVGNVAEWCSDWYARDYYARSIDARNPRGPEKGDMRVSRGGSWWNKGSTVCRCGYRLGYDAWAGLHDRGFRCARTKTSALT